MRIAGEGLGDAESRWQIADKEPGFDAVDSSKRWRFALDAPEKILDRARTTAGAHDNALGVVQNLAAKAEIARNTPDGRTKPDTLHPAAHANLDRDLLHRSRPVHGAAFLRRRHGISHAGRPAGSIVAAARASIQA